MEHSKEYLDWLARQFDEQLTERDKAFLMLVGIEVPSERTQFGVELDS